MHSHSVTISTVPGGTLPGGAPSAKRPVGCPHGAAGSREGSAWFSRADRVVWAGLGPTISQHRAPSGATQPPSSCPAPGLGTRGVGPGTPVPPLPVPPPVGTPWTPKPGLALPVRRVGCPLILRVPPRMTGWPRSRPAPRDGSRSTHVPQRVTSSSEAAIRHQGLVALSLQGRVPRSTPRPSRGSRPAPGFIPTMLPAAAREAQGSSWP